MGHHCQFGQNLVAGLLQKGTGMMEDSHPCSVRQKLCHQDGSRSPPFSLDALRRQIKSAQVRLNLPGRTHLDEFAVNTPSALSEAAFHGFVRRWRPLLYARSHQSWGRMYWAASS